MSGLWLSIAWLEELWGVLPRAALTAVGGIGRLMTPKRGMLRRLTARALATALSFSRSFFCVWRLFFLAAFLFYASIEVRARYVYGRPM